MFVDAKLLSRLLISMIRTGNFASFFINLPDAFTTDRMLAGEKVRLCVMWMKPLLAFSTLKFLHIVEIHRLTTIINSVYIKNSLASGVYIIGEPLICVVMPCAITINGMLDYLLYLDHQLLICGPLMESFL